METKSQTKSLKTVLAQLRDHSSWAGNYYGSNWRSEIAVLNPCIASVEHEIRFQEHTEDNPEKPGDYLVDFSGMSDEGAVIEHLTGIGEWNGFWLVRDYNLLTLTVHAWRELPEWTGKDSD